MKVYLSSALEASGNGSFNLKAFLTDMPEVVGRSIAYRPEAWPEGYAVQAVLD